MMDDKTAVINLLKGSEKPAKTIEEFIDSISRLVGSGESTLFIKESEAKQVADFVEQQEKYAELGRLALTTKAMVCSNNDFIKRGAKQCEKHCTNYHFCQKRAELLEGESNGQ